MEPEIFKILEAKGLDYEKATVVGIAMILLLGCDGNCSKCKAEHQFVDAEQIEAFGVNVSFN